MNENIRDALIALLIILILALVFYGFIQSNQTANKEVLIKKIEGYSSDTPTTGIVSFPGIKLCSTATRVRVELNGDVTVEHEYKGDKNRYRIPAYSQSRFNILTDNVTGEYWDIETRTEIANCGGGE